MTTTNLPYPPGPRGGLRPGQLLALRRDPAGYLLNLAQQYGDLVHFKAGTQHVYLLNHPDYVEEVLVRRHRDVKKGRAVQTTKRLLGEGLLTSEGAFHLRQRRLIQPIFHRQRIASYADDMVAYTARTRDRWRDGQTVDLHAEMMALTLAIVGKTLFGTEVATEAEAIGAAMHALLDAFGPLTGPFGSAIERLNLPPARRAAQARGRLNGIIDRMIAAHRANGDQGDLLSMLLAAQGEEGQAMSAALCAQMRDEAMTLFLAGHETTANALTWTWYLLSQHPEAEARLHAELDAALAGRLPALDDIPQLTYTRKVLSEAMRLYPPAWTMGRSVVNELELGGYTLPAGAAVVISQWVLHHDPRYYPDPFTFDPERWTSEAQAIRPKFAYFPFGAGARLCIGEQFAWMEGVLLIATLAQQWRMQHVPTHRVAPQPVITLRPRHGMRVTLERRI